VSAARLELLDVADQFAPNNETDDIETDTQGISGSGIQWYNDDSFIAANRRGSRLPAGEVLPIPMWTYYETGSDATSLNVVKTGPNYPVDVAVSISFFPETKFVVVSRSVPSNQTWVVQIYNAVTGQLVDTVDFTSDDSPDKLANLIVINEFQGTSSISSDGRLLQFAYTEGSITPGVVVPGEVDPNPTITYTNYHVGFLRVNPANGTFVRSPAVPPASLGPVIKFTNVIPDPEGDLAYGFGFVRPFGPTSARKYKFIVQEATFTPNSPPTAPRDAVALSVGYFDENTGLFKISLDELPDPDLPFTIIPEGITGIDLSEDGEYLVVVIREIAPLSTNPSLPPNTPLSVQKRPNSRTPNPDPNPDVPNIYSEIRFYGVGKYEIEYISAVEMSARMQFADLHGCGPCLKLVTGSRAYTLQRSLDQCNRPTIPGVAFSNPYVQAHTFTIDTETGKFFLQDTKPISVGTFGGAGKFNETGDRIAFVGRPTLTQWGSSLWSVSETH
jgi:hypothetical protein